MSRTDLSTATSDSTAPEALPPARTPVGTGPAPAVAILVALILIGIGVVGIHDALVRSAIISDGEWLRAAATWLDGRSRPAWLVLPAVAVVLLGLVILAAGLRRRPRKAVTVSARTGVHLRTSDLARIAETVVEGADGITDVDARATRRRLTVSVTTYAPRDANADLTTAVEERLSSALAPLDAPPDVRVHIRNEVMA